MKPYYNPILVLFTFLFLCISVSAQTETTFEGNGLISFLGKKVNSKEVKDLKSNYRCEMANELHYLSKDGIELIMRNNCLTEINLYAHSAVYGTYKGLLHKNLKFTMTSSEVKKLLGKPVINYNSGYCEYEYATYTLCCWFDGYTISQMGIAMKIPL